MRCYWRLAERLRCAAAVSPSCRARERSNLVVTVGKSLVLDNAMNIQRISLANGDPR